MQRNITPLKCCTRSAIFSYSVKHHSIVKGNPLAMTRTCNACHCQNLPACLTIGKTTAKAAFLLSEKDLKQLPQAALSCPEGIIGKKPCTMVMFLGSDVVSASHTKWNACLTIGKTTISGHVRPQITPFCGHFLRFSAQAIFATKESW